VWSLVVVTIILLVQRDGAWIADLVRRPARMAQLTAGALLLGVNWLVYIWSVNNDHVVEASLGYFINPLVTVALGVLVLGERLRALQWTAVGLGVVAVAVLTWASGRPPWIALTLAFSFAGYGFIKKQVPLTAPQSLAAETAVLTPLALGAVAVMAARDTATFTTEGPDHVAWLVSAGPVTAVPLLCFAVAARRIPLTMLGLLQYLTPTLQFLCGVLVFGEHLSAARWAGVIMVWAALGVLSGDALRQRGRAPELTAASSSL
jgi:chloramphenicol-sensitive protein RarD